MEKKNKVLHWNGTTQSERLLKSLLPEYVKVDERSLSDILAFSEKYARLIKFYDVDNSPSGDWSYFLSNDIAVFLSSIIATNLNKIEQRHKLLISQLENAPRAKDRLDHLEDLFVQVIDVAEMINNWYVQALDMNSLKIFESSDLEDELESAIKQKLAYQLHLILRAYEELGFAEQENYTVEAIQERFHPIWFKLDQSSEEYEQNVDSTEDKIQYYTKDIRIRFRTLYSVSAYIIQTCPKFLKKALEENREHRADIGLFITFIELFKHAQNQMNTLTEKHLDFYYYNVLRQEEKGLTADKANVYFDLSQHVDQHLLPKDTRISAGRDNSGVEHFYTTDEDLMLNKAKIEQLSTVFLSKNTLTSIDSSYRLITNMYAANQARSKDGKGAKFLNNEENWPTFGHEILDIREEERQMDFANIGMALASPILEMEEGHRVVNLRMTFEKESMYTLNLLVKDLGRKLSLSREDAFSKVFKDSVQLFFTTEKGWYEASTCEVLPPSDWTKPEISIVATLNTAAPAIIGFDASTMQGDFETNSPMIKILQRSKDTIYSYSFLKELQLNKVFIDVSVSGIKRLSLSSDMGVVDSNVPFQPFGAIPRVGSYLMIGKSELFKKNLTNMELDIEWHNIPDNSKGLRGHYEEYDMGIKNDSYKVKLTALSNGSFFPSAEDVQLEYDLFTADDKNPEAVNKKTQLSNINVSALNIKPSLDLEIPSVYSNEAKTGYLKLELTSPVVGFGHKDYANIYTKAITFNTNPNRKGKEKKLPKEPFTPMIRNLSLNYEATTQINVLSIDSITHEGAINEQLYHIHPFGEINTFKDGKCSTRSLLPNYDDDAYLFIGLKDFVAPNSLTLYFELKENLDVFSDFNNQGNSPEVYWSYLCNDEWLTFSQNQILSDTTDGFNKSGIIHLDIPRDISLNNQILNGDLHWLRITLKGNASIMPRTLRVATQAVSVTWAHNGNSEEHLRQNLPANSMTALATPQAAIRGVHQDFPSFGGRMGEGKKEFYTRISERLRHKNRANSAWDYERIVLDKFPSIYQVKCITHAGHEDDVAVGNVVLVVVPKFEANAQSSYALPIVNHTTLEQIKAYLQELSSPFVNITVRNPIYERVKLSAGVSFTKGKNNGTYLKKLNQDVINFMCPWMIGKGKELDLGGNIAKDVVLSFIEKLPYVDFVTKFSAVQIFPETKGFDLEDTAVDNSSAPILEASKPWSVLIPFEMNPIYILDEENFQIPEKSAIDSMIIGGDFVMTKNRDDDDFYNFYDTERRKK